MQCSRCGGLMMAHWDDDAQCVICGFIHVPHVFNDKKKKRGEGWVNVYQNQRYTNMELHKDQIIFDWNEHKKITVQFEYEPRKIYERSWGTRKSKIIYKAALSGLWLPDGYSIFPATVLERRLRQAIEDHIDMILIAKLYFDALLNVIYVPEKKVLQYEESE